MKPALITVWVIGTVLWVVFSLTILAHPQVTTAMAELNEAAGTDALSWLSGLLLVFGPPLIVYAVALFIGKAFRREPAQSDR